MLTWVSQLQNAWKPVGFLPKLVCGPSKDTDGFRNAKRQLHFDCLEALLSSVIQVFEAGGFYAYIPALQETQCFLPVVAFIMQDSKEGDFLTGIRTGVLTKFGCRVCFTESRYFCNPFVSTAGHFRHDTGDESTLRRLKLTSRLMDAAAAGGLRQHKSKIAGRTCRCTWCATRYGRFHSVLTLWVLTERRRRSCCTNGSWE
jgi:hypothetical protein